MSSLFNLWKERRTMQTDHQDDLIMNKARKDLLHDPWQPWWLPPLNHSGITYQQLRQCRIPINLQLTGRIWSATLTYRNLVSKTELRIKMLACSGKSSRELSPSRGEYMCQMHCANKWYASSMITLNPVTLDRLGMLISYPESSIGSY